MKLKIFIPSWKRHFTRKCNLHLNLAFPFYERTHCIPDTQENFHGSICQTRTRCLTNMFHICAREHLHILNATMKLKCNCIPDWDQIQSPFSHNIVARFLLESHKNKTPATYDHATSSSTGSWQSVDFISEDQFFMLHSMA